MTDNSRQKAVAKAVQRWRVRPFARGTGDCCAFADFVVHELTGSDSFLPYYQTDQEAEEIIASHGGLSGAVTAFMERPPVDPQELEPGDVVLVTVLEHEAVGILVTPKTLVTVFEDGNPRALPSGLIDHGWRTWA